MGGIRTPTIMTYKVCTLFLIHRYEKKPSQEVIVMDLVLTLDQAVVFVIGFLLPL